jgi:hypothetical protein
MRYQDIKENYSPEKDEHSKQELSDTRRSRMTLMHISRLRKIREYRKYEQEMKKGVLVKIYNTGDDGGDSMGEM